MFEGTGIWWGCRFLSKVKLGNVWCVNSLRYFSRDIALLRLRPSTCTGIFYLIHVRCIIIRHRQQQPTATHMHAMQLWSPTCRMFCSDIPCNIIRTWNVPRWDSQIEFVCFGNLWTNVRIREETPVTFIERSMMFLNFLLSNRPLCFSLTKPASFADCVGDELPMGWEQVLDPSRGVYYVNHGESKSENI